VRKEYLKIRDVCEVFDGPHATPTKTDEGPFYLSISSLNRGTLDLSKSAHLSEQEFQKWTKRVTPRKGDLLFSYETRLGEAALMPDGIKACLGRRMGILRPDTKKVLPEYLLRSLISNATLSRSSPRSTPRSPSTTGSTASWRGWRSCCMTTGSCSMISR
jgi:type I restriction enzyme, S subunit